MLEARSSGWWSWGLLLSAVLSVSGCSGSDAAADGNAGGGDDTASVGGQVTAEWRSYCVATLTQSHSAMDPFGDLFSVGPGDAFLLTEYEALFNRDHARLAYLTPDGPSTFDIDVDTGTPFPFTTSCAFGKSTQYYAAFTDVTVYATAALWPPVCDLSARNAVARDKSKEIGFRLVDAGFSVWPTYEVELNAFSARCGGALSGFISVPPTRLFESSKPLVPITVVLGPH